ncbi:MAG: hypothetical protein ABFQ62_00090 [Patescibacteria group bacterium]
MQRGVLKLNNKQLDVCLQQLAGSSQDVQFLIEKLTHAKETVSLSATVELSEDEVDILLDALPAPQANEIKDLSSLRQNLQKFLMQLRNKQSKKPSSFLTKLNPLNWFR